MSQRRNDVAAADRHSMSRDQFWRLIDDAPPAVRRAMWEAGVDWSPLNIIKAYDRQMCRASAAEAARFACLVVRDYDAREREAFADAYEKKHKAPYPARAARSTIQRYERRR